MIFIIPLAFVVRAEEAYYLPKLIILLTGLPFIVFFAADFSAIKLKRYDAALIIFLLFYSFGLAAGGENSLMRFLEWVSAAVLYFYARFFLTPEKAKKAVYTALVSGVFVSVYALAQVFGMDFSGWLTDFSGRAFSSFGNPDFLGGFLVILIPMSLVPAAVSGRIKLSVFLYFLFTATLLFSQTRSSMAAFFAGLLVMVVLFRKNIKVSLKYAAGGLVILALITCISGRAPGLGSRISAAFDLNNADLSGRVNMWKAGIKMLSENPVTGTGINSIKKSYYRYKPDTSYYETERLHNDYIDIAAESGILAGLSFLVFCWLLLAALLGKKGSLGGITAVSLAGLFVHAVFNFPFYIIGSKVYFFALAGCALAEGKGENERLPVILTFAALVFLIAGFSGRMLYGSAALNYGINSLNAGDERAAEYFLLKAEKYSPGCKKYYALVSLLMKKGDLEKASEFNSFILEKAPMSKKAVINAAIINAEQGNLKKARGYLDNFLEFYPGDIDILNNLGKILYLSGDVKGAISIYEAVLENDPWNRTARDNLYGINMMERNNSQFRIPDNK